MTTPQLRVEDTLAQYRNEQPEGAVHANRDHVVVALAGGPEAATLLSRGARLAARADGRLDAVHVVHPGHDADNPPATIAKLRELTDDAGGTLHAVVAEDSAEAVLDLARGVHATTIVVGVSCSTRWTTAFRSGVSDRIVTASGDIDVLMVTHPYARAARLASPRIAGHPLGRGRLILGWLLALTAPLLLTLALLPLRGSRTPAFEALAFIAVTVLCALAGGLWPALTAGLISSVLLNFFFTPPVHTLGIANVEDLVALLLFLLIAVAVASVVGEAARRAVQADLARRESDTLSLLNQTLLRGDHDLTALLDLVRDTFAMTSAALLARPDGTDGPARSWRVLASSGPNPPRTPDHGDVSAEASATARLVLRGRALPAHDIRVLSAFATHLAVVADRERLAAQTAAAQRLEEGNRLRTALLAAVSHDLRTPLAGIKAAVSTLRTPGVTWSREDEADLLGAIEESADRLGAIIANLLDLTRLQTGAVQLATQDVGLDDVVARTVRTLLDADRVHVDVAPDLPAVRVDVGLLERVMANLVENALRYSPSPARVDVTAEAAGTQVRLRVIDHGPGIDQHDKERLFQPFQRLGDAPSGEGVGLGLAVAAGLTAAVGGQLTAHETPGGGLTMLVDLPAAPSEHLDAPLAAHTGWIEDATAPRALRPS
jgi:two-component system, OmpR family, sensor histidine kinase KdpD